MGVWTPGPTSTEGDDVFTGDSSNETVFGNGGNDILNGNGGNDWLGGGAGDDTINGGDGQDTVVGDGGDDVLNGGNDNDDLVDFSAGVTGILSIDGGEGNDFIDLAGDFLSGTVNGGNGYDGVDWSGAFNSVNFVNVEVLITNGGPVTASASQLQSFSEIWYNQSHPNLAITLALSAAGVVDLSTQLGNRAAGFLGSIGADTITLGGGNDIVAGLDGNDVLSGQGGSDQIAGNDGDDVLYGDAGDDGLVGGLGNDTLYGGIGNDELADEGDLGAVTLMYGGDGNDLLQLADQELLASATLDGGADTDQVLVTGLLTNITFVSVEVLNTGLYSLTRATAAQFESFDLIGQPFGVVLLELIASGTIDLHDELVAGADFYGASGADTITMSAYQDFIFGMGGADFIDGREGNDTLNGGEANDILRGGLGGDTLNGGNGVDTADYLGAAAGVSAFLGAGTETGEAAGDSYTLIENLRGSNFDDVLVGDTASNQLSGEGGADTLDGGTGADTMIGGAGNDTYVVDNAGDTVTEAASAGTDSVQSSLTFTLGANVENLTLTGASAINGTGNTLNNTITGNGAVNILTGGDGADYLDGGLGADTMIGGIGDDTFVVDNGSDVVTENASEGTDTIRSSVGVAALAANVENLVLLGSAVTGNGNGLNNTITGNAANNNINGLAGADTMIGGDGNDTYIIDNAGDVVTESSGQGTDTIFSTVTIAALAQNVENLTLSGTALNANGNSLNNTITGNAQKNTLNGGSGEDTLIGGLDSDTYIYNSAGDVIVEAADAGISDTVIAFIDVAALMANVEHLTLAGSAMSGTGNGLNNILTGNASNNTLTGGLGNDQLNGALGADTLIGNEGDDTYLVENAGDVVIEAFGEGASDVIYAWVSLTIADNVERATLVGPGNLNIIGNTLSNRIYGNDDNNTLTGLDGDDIIGGLAGNDIITGGAGRDQLTGYAGNDTFVYQLISDSGLNGATRDIIYDFTQGEDVINLSAIDAIAGGGDDAFSFIAAGAFTNTAGELRYEQTGGYTIISMDVNGDGLADSQITLVGTITLTVGDFGP